MRTTITIVIASIIALLIMPIIEKVGSAKAEPTYNTEWNEGTFALHRKIVEMGVDSELAVNIIGTCKATAIDPRKCVKTTVAIYGNESSFGKHCKNNSCWGFIGKSYTTQAEASEDFIKRFNLYWFRHNGGEFFYGGLGWIGRSNYCTSEKSSGTKVGCPNGRINFDYFYNKL